PSPARSLFGGVPAPLPLTGQSPGTRFARSRFALVERAKVPTICVDSLGTGSAGRRERDEVARPTRKTRALVRRVQWQRNLRPLALCLGAYPPPCPSRGSPPVLASLARASRSSGGRRFRQSKHGRAL